MSQKIKLIVKTSRDEMIKARNSLVARFRSCLRWSDDMVETRDTLYILKSVSIDKTPLTMIQSQTCAEIDIEDVIDEYTKILNGLKMLAEGEVVSEEEIQEEMRDQIVDDKNNKMLCDENDSPSGKPSFLP